MKLRPLHQVCMVALWVMCTGSFALAPLASLSTVVAAPAAADPAPPQFLRDLPSLSGLISPGDAWTIGGGFLYWAQCPAVDSGGGYLRRWPLRGGRVVTIVNGRFCTNTATWAADESGLYYGDGSNILRRPASNPFIVETIAASAMPTSRIILNNGTTIWRDEIFWLANNILYGANRYDHTPFAQPEPLGSNAHSLLFANDNHFYWFADGVLYKALKPCLAFGGGACIKHVVANENGDNVTDATLEDVSLSSSTFPIWTSGINIRGIWCRFNTIGRECSSSTSYASALNNSVGSLATDGTFLFWVENRADVCGGIFGCSFGNNGRLMKWRISRSFFTPDNFDTPQQIACKQCFANYTISGIPGDVAVADGWVYFDTSNGLSRIRADAPPLTANLAADSMEVTQGIQNLNNDVPLIADKPTYVRLYGRKLSGPNTYSVEAVLYGTHSNGTRLPGSPLRPINGGQDVTANNVDPNRATTQGNWLFQLPDTWVNAGTITLRPLIDPSQVWSDPDQNNNSLANRSVTFTRKAPICIVTVPVRSHAPPASNSDPSLYRMVDIVRQMMPTSDVWIYHQNTDVAQLEARFGIPPWKYEPYAIPEKGDAILRALWLRDALSDDPDRCDDAGALTHYVGLVHASTNTKGNLGKGSTPGANLYIKLIDSATLNTTTQFWQRQAFNTLAHELAHNYGRQHVNCGGPANPDPGFPYRDMNGLNCVLDDGLRGGNAIPAHQRYYGFDTQSLTPVDPGTTADYMTYRAPFWVSDYTWRGLFGGINMVARNTSTQQSAVAMAQTRSELAAADSVVYITGSVDLTANTGSLDYAWVYPANTLTQGMQTKLQESAAPRAGEVAPQADTTYTLRLRDAANTLLDERVVTLQDTADGDSSAEPFALTMPAPTTAVARLELVSGDSVIATLEPGSGAPTITILNPTGGETITNQMTLSWQASDPDASDSLLFTVQYSPDSGQHWQTMLTNLPNLASGDTVTLDLNNLSGLPGSTTGALMRVAASDGYNTTLATSQPFVVTRRAPEPHIDVPGSAAVPAGQVVIVRGGATDVQDGGLSGSALNWTLDGQEIGSGTQLSLTGLAPGEYTLALTASNTDGMTATATSTLTIAPLVIPQSSAPTLDGTCDDPAYATAPQLPLAPYADGSQAFVRLVRSSNALYTCFVGMQRTSGSSPGTLAGIRVDTNHSRDTRPQPGDYVFLIGEDGVIATYNGNGSGYVTPGPGGVTGQVSANTTTWMAELRIDANTLDGWGHVVGLDVEQAWVGAVADDYFWPHSATWNNPGSWATTVLGEVAQISSIGPDSAPVGSGDTMLTVDGSGFVAGATVLWNGAPLQTNVISNTQVQATISAAELATAGFVDVAVVNPGLEAARSNSLIFSVVNPMPTIAQADLVGTTVTVSGDKFAAGATVQINGTTYLATRDSPIRLRATISATDAAIASDTTVTVYNPEPGGGVSNSITLRGNVGGSALIYLPLVAR